MVRVGRHGIAGDFSIDGDSSSTRMVKLFQHQNGGPFAEDKPVPIFVKRPAGPLRRVIARRKGAQRIEAIEDHRSDH